MLSGFHLFLKEAEAALQVSDHLEAIGAILLGCRERASQHLHLGT
jgi:hypothetical protein